MDVATTIIAKPTDVRATVARVPTVLDLTFADGLRGEVEVLYRMRGPGFTHATTVAGFSAVEVDAESGTFVWPGGADFPTARSTSVSELACGPSNAPPSDDGP